MNIVAEGVETSEQLDFLRLNDCSEVQGYFVGLPKPINEIERYLLGAGESGGDNSTVRYLSSRAKFSG